MPLRHRHGSVSTKSAPGAVGRAQRAVSSPHWHVGHNWSAATRRHRTARRARHRRTVADIADGPLLDRVDRGPDRGRCRRRRSGRSSPASQAGLTRGRHWDVAQRWRNARAPFNESPGVDGGRSPYHCDRVTGSPRAMHGHLRLRRLHGRTPLCTTPAGSRRHGSPARCAHGASRGVPRSRDVQRTASPSQDRV